jgi:redox-sensing transcriptional repressor
MKKQKRRIPKPAIERLCKIYSLLKELQESGSQSISSREIGMRLGVGSHNIRKDIGYLCEAGITGSGYDIAKLKSSIDKAFGFSKKRNSCIIGLGTLAKGILDNQDASLASFKIVAGFDSNINKLETFRTSIPVYPTYEIEAIIQKENIDLAIITQQDPNMSTISSRLIDGGIKGILNFSPMTISTSHEEVMIRNIDLFGEFRYLSALLTLDY